MLINWYKIYSAINSTSIQLKSLLDLLFNFLDLLSGLTTLLTVLFDFLSSAIFCFLDFLLVLTVLLVIVFYFLASLLVLTASLAKAYGSVLLI